MFLGYSIIPDIRKAWRFLSLRFIAVAAAIQLSLIAFPDELRQYVPDAVMHVLVLVALTGAVIGRLVQQPAPPEK